MNADSVRRGDRLAALLLGTLGLALFFRFELASGFATVKGHQFDDRQALWVLEWIARCVSGDPLCSDVWSAPFFHPAPGALAFGDPTLGLGWIYAGVRALGPSPAPAFVITQMLMLALAYLAALWMLRWALCLPVLPAALGAFLFAYGAPIAAQADHPHLFALFPIPILVGALARLLEETDHRRRRSMWILATAAWVAQAYLNLTLFWLTSFVIVCLLLAGLALRSTRAVLLGAARQDLAPALTAAALAGAAVYPLLRRMGETQLLVGGARTTAQWLDFAPQPESWLNVGAQNWVWGFLSAWPPIRDLPFAWEHELGVGLLTTAACLGGAWLGRRRPALLALFLAAGVAGLLTLRWPGGWTLWTAIHAFWPGAQSVRALGRFSLVLLAPAALALALAAERLLSRGPRGAFAMLAAVVLLEQQRSFDTSEPAVAEARVAALAAVVPADCPSFFWSPRGSRGSSTELSPAITQVDAMWAAFATGKPTVNGYTSYAPPGWYDLHRHRVDTRPRRAQLRDYLSYWAAQSGAARGEICWILTTQEGDSSLLPRGLERIDPERSPWPPVESASAATAGSVPGEQVGGFEVVGE